MSDAAPPAPRAVPAWRAPLLGAVCAAAFGVVLHLLPELGLDLLSLVLAVQAGVIIGATGERTRRVLSAETGAALALVFSAVQGLWWAGAWLAPGYAVHAAAASYFALRRARARGEPWRPTFSLVFSLLIALAVLVLP